MSIARVSDLAASADRLPRIAEDLTPDERVRYARYRHDTDRAMFALGRHMARSLVGAALGVAPAAWTWREGPHGRPEIAEPATDLRFNLSHSAGVVVCALARGRDVGVDVENLARRTPDPAVVLRYCSPEEAADVRARGRTWHERFLTYWTLKEAYLKARGLGISVPLSDITFHLDADRARLSFAGALAGTDDRWAFHLQRLDPHHLLAVAAAAADGAMPRFIVRAF